MNKLKRAIESGGEITEKHFNQITEKEQRKLHNQLQSKFLEQTDILNDITMQRLNTTKQLYKVQKMFNKEESEEETSNESSNETSDNETSSNEEYKGSKESETSDSENDENENDENNETSESSSSSDESE